MLHLLPPDRPVVSVELLPYVDVLCDCVDIDPLNPFLSHCGVLRLKAAVCV
jgi:hypothetical protein